MILHQEMLLSADENQSIMQWMDNEGMEAMGKNNDRQQDGRGQTMADEVQLVTFNIGEEEYGIYITQIQEINRLGKITRLPKSPDFIEGVTNLRGEVIPVIDTKKRFGLDLRDNDDRTRIIIVDMAGKKTGLIADRVNEVLRLPTSNISPPPPVMSTRTEAQFLSGIGKLDNGERMILLLDAEKILNIEEQEALQQIAATDKSDDKPRKSTKSAKPAKKKTKAKKNVTKKTTAKKSTAKTKNTSKKKTTPPKKAKKKLTIAE
jgi:purine-binding chemotaxis protein CheW